VDHRKAKLTILSTSEPAPHNQATHNWEIKSSFYIQLEDLLSMQPYVKLERCNPWPHVANHQPLSLWRHSLLSWPRPLLRTYECMYIWTVDTLPRLIYKDYYDHLFIDLTDPKCATALPVNRWHLSRLAVASGNFPVDSNLKKACPIESVFPDDQLSAPTRSRHVTIQLWRQTEKWSTTCVDIHRTRAKHSVFYSSNSINTHQQ